VHKTLQFETVKGRAHLEGLGIDERKILECTLKKKNGRVRIALMWLRIEAENCLLDTDLYEVNEIGYKIIRWELVYFMLCWNHVG
jgi:hypothetical protein